MSHMKTLEKSRYPKTVVDILGGTRSTGNPIRNVYDFVLLARDGLAKSSVESVISFTGMSKRRFAEDILFMSVRTLERKQADDKFDQKTSSSVIEVAKVLAHAYVVFNDKEKVESWLSNPNKALHGNSPLSLFSTPTGIAMVEDVLTRIEEGVYS